MPIESVQDCSRNAGGYSNSNGGSVTRWWCGGTIHYLYIIYILDTLSIDNLYGLHVHSISIVCIHTVSLSIKSFSLCIISMRDLYTLSFYNLSIHIVYTDCLNTLSMHIVRAQRLYTLSIHITYTHTHTNYTHYLCTLSWHMTYISTLSLDMISRKHL